jgi:hypothetical protein
MVVRLRETYHFMVSYFHPPAQKRETFALRASTFKSKPKEIRFFQKIGFLAELRTLSETGRDVVRQEYKANLVRKKVIGIKEHPSQNNPKGH